ncbi:hypothetical protein NDK50_00920 [Paraburkholderia bryophila]|uniref:hypothetical protein n=1 Tax=Paraburkholderia bryophila TaxID=420952 RepID=UPI00234BDA11|nr:hypothetical protein [Paraburkholderia bryophila]WCM20075.1 hypothetical protein NDK50_00920 [Paraburkholderia bryophila]
MTNKVVHRDERFIQLPTNQEDFEKLCVRIYGEMFHDPGARRYGRPGQGQQGLDILVHDFRRSPVEKRQGMVFVQCKYTEKDELPFSKLESDAREARALVESHEAYEGVYLFIVATTAKNSATLHAKLQTLQAEERLPFEIQLHSRDTLLSRIQESDRLWDLYNVVPERVPTEFALQVLRVATMIRSQLQEGLLADACEEDSRRRCASRIPTFGQRGSCPPEDIWKQSTSLRETLINLYAKAADTWSAAPLLEYEASLGGMRNGDSWLAYLLAQRTVENLRSHEAHLPLANDRDRFTQQLTNLADVICRTEGSPDVLGCLALLLIMETNRQDIHDAALNLMTKVIESGCGTLWELSARIAHAVVRYYYVLRWGWNGSARFYALGDSLDSGLCIGPSSLQLGQPFSHDDRVTLRIIGIDPLGAPRWSGAQAFALPRAFFRWLRNEDSNLALPQLAAQCQVYSAQDFVDNGPTWGRPETSHLGNRRIVDLETLAVAATENQHLSMISSYRLVATYHTFERLLGYRAFLRAYVHRTSGNAGTYATLMARVESLVDSCEACPTPVTSKSHRISITPLYDNPPQQLLYSAPSPTPGPASPFTLPRERLEWIRQSISSWPFVYVHRMSLEQRYRDRSDEFSLACLLALHTASPIFTYKYEKVIRSQEMGIAAEYPGRRETISQGTASVNSL